MQLEIAASFNDVRFWSGLRRFLPFYNNGAVLSPAPKRRRSPIA